MVNGSVFMVNISWGIWLIYHIYFIYGKACNK
jgi:hypothetical protein